MNTKIYDYEKLFDIFIILCDIECQNFKGIMMDQNWSRKLNINNLVVVDFRSKDMNEKVSQWRRKKKTLFAESCARQVWYGTEDEFKDFPIQEIAGCYCTQTTGAEAYKYLLELITGLRSKRTCDPRVSGDFFKSWSQINREFPEKADVYGTFIQDITADSRLTRRILAGFKTQRHELAARDLSGFEDNQSVIIIPHISNKEELSTFSDGMVRVLASNKTRHAREIAITHPDPDTLVRLCALYEELQERCKISTDITHFNFEYLSEALDLYDQAYCALPMGTDLDADKFMIQCLKEQSKTPFIHLKGDPQKSAQSTKDWKKAKLQNYISPEDIREEMAQRMKMNTNLVLRAKLTVQLCADARLNGKRASFKSLQQDAPDLFITEG